jgi:hypothetical protein
LVSPFRLLFAQRILPGISQINGESSHLSSSLSETISFGQSQPASLGPLLRSGSTWQPWTAGLPALDQPPTRCSGAMRQVCFGSIAVPAVEGWQLLYFGGTENNVGLFLFRESRFMDRVIAPAVSACRRRFQYGKSRGILQWVPFGHPALDHSASATSPSQALHPVAFTASAHAFPKSGPAAHRHRSWPGCLRPSG